MKTLLSGLFSSLLGCVCGCDRKEILPPTVLCSEGNLHFRIPRDWKINGALRNKAGQIITFCSPEGAVITIVCGATAYLTDTASYIRDWRDMASKFPSALDVSNPEYKSLPPHGAFNLQEIRISIILKRSTLPYRHLVAIKNQGAMSVAIRMVSPAEHFENLKAHVQEIADTYEHRPSTAYAAKLNAM